MTPPRPSVSFLLLGAGSGTRLGGCSKAFLQLDDKTLLEHAIDTVAGLDGEILVGLSLDDLTRGSAITAGRARVHMGGATRQDTITRLLSNASGRIVVVHDIARPFATLDLFRAVITAAHRYGAAATVVPNEVRDSLCQSDGGFVGATIDRANLMQVQTPQAFDRIMLREVIEDAVEAGLNETSLVNLCRWAGRAVKLVDGDIENIKITYPGDLPAPAILGAATST